MKANVGMIYPVASVVQAYTPYTSITYGTGFVVDEGREANVQYETADGEFFGDDILLDSYEDVIAYTIDFETTGLKDTVRAKLLGEVQVSTSSVYKVTGAPKPYVGFGFVRKMRDSSSGSVVTNYEAWWYYRVRFGQPNETTRTQERNMEWRAPSMSGRGTGIFTTSAQEHPDFCEHETFTTLAAAKAYLNGLAGISSGTTT